MTILELFPERKPTALPRGCPWRIAISRLPVLQPGQQKEGHL